MCGRSLTFREPAIVLRLRPGEEARGELENDPPATARGFCNSNREWSNPMDTLLERHSLWLKGFAEAPGLFNRGAGYPGARHRRQHGDFLL